MKTILLFLLTACGTYTDPEQEKLIYYSCENNQTIVLKHSDDYQDMRMKIGKEQILFHHFVSERGEGYRTEKYLWLVSGENGKLMARREDGSEESVLSDCRSQAQELDY